jgi:hypothetical protein
MLLPLLFGGGRTVLPAGFYIVFMINYKNGITEVMKTSSEKAFSLETP